MILYPAIDLKNGQCVRLYQGEMDAATIYNNSPADQAQQFQAEGFTHLHMVDLDGAVSGGQQNFTAVQNVLSKTTLPVQLGGGIRTYAAAERWLQAGISRIILGTAALRDPELVKTLAKDYPGRIIVGIDAKNGMVAVEGWEETSSMAAIDLAKAFEDAGVASIIYTDIARDGTLSGPNLEETANLARGISIPVILSGGIGTLADVQQTVENYADCIAGIIMGRALYEKKINANQALALAKSIT